MKKEAMQAIIALLIVAAMAVMVVKGPKGALAERVTYLAGHNWSATK